MTNQKKAPAAIETNPEDTTRVSITPVKVGHFIVINTKNITGLRINLEKIRTYAQAGADNYTIGVGWDNGTQTALQYTNQKDVDAVMEVLDGYCI